MTHSNSKAAYKGHKESGQLGAQQQTIFDELTKGSCTRQQVSERTGISINAVCGRVKELLNAEEIIESGSDNSTGRKRAILVAAKKGYQMKLFQFREL